MRSTLLVLAVAALLIVPAGLAVAPTYCVGAHISAVVRFLFDFVSDPEALYDVDLDETIDYLVDITCDD